MDPQWHRTGTMATAALFLITACVSPSSNQRRLTPWDPYSGSRNGQAGAHVDINAIDSEWRRNFYRRNGYLPPIGFVYINRNQPERFKQMSSTPPSPEEFKDSNTGYIWARCEEGQSWNGSTCIGKRICFTYEAAQDHSFSRAWLEEKPWRVPSIQEISSAFAAIRQAEPAILETSSMWLWSSQRPVGGGGGYIGYVVQPHSGKYAEERLGACLPIRLMRIR